MFWGTATSERTAPWLVSRAAIAAVALGLASPLAAQTGQDASVRLEANDGSAVIVGELVEFDDGLFTVDTALGLITLEADDVSCVGAICPTEDAEAETTVNNIRLASEDGQTEVFGELVGFEDGIYTIDTLLGQLQIASEDVTCFGAACPRIEQVRTQFAISGGRYAIADFIPTMFEKYAQSAGFIYNEIEDDGQRVIRLLDGQDGSVSANIRLNEASTAGSFAALASKQSDIAIVDQLLPEIMWRDVAQQYQIAHDALVFITHENNPVRDLTLPQLGDIWAGRTTNWQILGGGDFPIAVHMSLEEDSQIPLVFYEGVLVNNGFNVTDLDTVTFHETADGVMDAIRDDRTAIGVVSRVTAEDARARTVDLRKSCGLTSAPTDFEIKVENYPLSRPVLAYMGTSNPHPIAVDFLEWTRRNEAQLHVADAGFGGDTLQRMRLRDMGVGIIQTSVSEDFDGVQFSGMLRELQNADRLSITFRFEEGSTRLDAESVGFVQDLANRLRANEFEGLEVLQVGFADSSGDAGINTQLALDRAETVRQILLAEFDSATAARFNLTALSFGEQMPIDCNTDEAGRANNRRVEIWVRQPR